MAQPTDTVSLRITLRYQNLDEFVSRYAENISSAGLFLRTKAPKPAGTKIRFELLLADGAKALRGEGVVVTVRQDDKPGMALRFNTLDAESQAVIDRIVEEHGHGALAPTPLSTGLARPSGETKGKAATSWRAQKGGPQSWSASPLPRTASNASLLPRRASRLFGTGTGELVMPPMPQPSASTEAPADPSSESAPPSPEAAAALPRKRSSVPRPWASSTARPGGEVTDRIRVRELAPKLPFIKADEHGPTQRINTPPPSVPPASEEREAERTVRIEVDSFHSPPRPPGTQLYVEASPVGAAHVPSSEFGSSGESGVSQLQSATADVRVDEVTGGLPEMPQSESGVFVPEAIVTPADPGSFEDEATISNETSEAVAPVAPPSEPAIASSPVEPEPMATEASAPSEPAAMVEPPATFDAAPAPACEPEPAAAPQEEPAPPIDPTPTPSFAERVAAYNADVTMPEVALPRSPSPTPIQAPRFEAAPEPLPRSPSPTPILASRFELTPLPAMPEATPDEPRPPEPEATSPVDAGSGWADALGIPSSTPAASGNRGRLEDQTPLLNLTRSEDEAAGGIVAELHSLSGDLGPSTQVIDRPPEEAPHIDLAEAAAELGTGPSHQDTGPLLPESTPARAALPTDDGSAQPSVQALPPIEPPRALFAMDEPTTRSADPRPVVSSTALAFTGDPDQPHSSLDEAAAALGLDLAEIRARAVTDAATEIGEPFHAPSALPPRPESIRERPEITEVSSRDLPPEPPRDEARSEAPPSDPPRSEGARPRSNSVPSGAFSAQVSVTGIEAPARSESNELAPESPRPPPRVGPFRPVIERDHAPSSDDPAEMLREARAAAFSEENTEIPPERDTAPAASTNLVTERAQPPVLDRATSEAPQDKSRVVGIDLGGHWVRVGIIEHGELELIPVGGSSYLPALVAARADGSLAVGTKARTILHDDPTRAVSPMMVLRAIKGGTLDSKRAGVRVISFDGQRVLLKLGERTVDFAEVLITFLGTIKGAVAAHIGNERFRALLALSAQLDPDAQRILEAACHEARLRVVKLVPDAEVMLQAYNLQEHQVESVLLVDVGIGRLGLAVARRNKGTLQVVASAEDFELTASQIDRLVTDLTLEELASKANEDHRQDPAAQLRLLEAVEHARLDIRRLPTIDLKVSLPAPGGAAGVGVERSIKLPRARIYQTTESWVRDICAKVQDVLREAGVDPRALGAVVIAGSGGTYPPLVQAIGQMAQKEPLIALPPAQVFAVGLARAGVALERTESASRPDTLHASIGMELPGERFRPLIGAGAKLPAHLERTYPSTRDNQAELELKLYQGDAEFVRSCTPLGTLLLMNLPKGDRGTVKLMLRLDVAVDGVLTATLLEATEALEHTLVIATAQTPPERKKNLPLPRPPPRRTEPAAKQQPGFFGRFFKK